MENFDYDKWKEKYQNVEIVDLRENLNDTEPDTISKLGIELKDKVYTQYEFDALEMKILDYYIDDELDNEVKEFLKELPSEVSREEYNRLVEKIEEIKIKYGF